MATGTIVKTVTTQRRDAVVKQLATYPERLRKITEHALSNPMDKQYRCVARKGRRIKTDSRRIKIKRNKYRALAVVTETKDALHFDWWFLGTHAEYDKLF